MKNVALITGASSGIGRAIAQQFSKENWHVLLVGRNQNRLEETQKLLSGESEIFTCDLSQASEVKKLVQGIGSFKNSLGALINNAGVYIPNTTAKDSDDVWEKHFNTNLMSAVRLTRHLWPTLVDNGGGAILNISSTLAIRPIAAAGAYSALKSAMNNWTLTLAIEGAPHKIRANSICPGLVETPIHGFHGSDKPEDKQMLEQLQSIQPLGRTGQPQDIAPMAQQLCSQGSAWTTGAIINIDGGILLNS